MAEYALEMRNVTKVFPGVKALDDVTFKVKKGEVHALVGENGAGKSTLMMVLNGVYTPTSGTIVIDGNEVKNYNINDAKNCGLSLIFQELNLVSTLSVAENIYLNKLKLDKVGLVDWKSVRRDANDLLKKINFPLDVNTLVSKLTVAEKQMVEIAKSLSINAKIIIMDEPTSSFTQNETENLFDIIRSLKKDGITVIYISHRLEEIFSICDSVTVMRDGHMIDTKVVAETSREEIIEKMVGRSMNMVFPKRDVKPEEVVLEVKDVTRKNLVKNISFNLRKKEVLGIAGLVGSGRMELAEALFGAEKIDSGEMIINGKKVVIHSTKDAKENSIGMVTDDRKESGLVLAFSILQNITVTNFRKVVKFGFVLNKKLEEKFTDQYIKDLNIRTPSLYQNTINLSGGNQQKVVLAKWLFSDVDILILDEPTRGIDVGAKYEIYVLINKLVSQGKSIVMISSELPEIIGMCDRVMVMHNGVNQGELTGGEITAEAIMNLAIA
jgi:ribose transport system ATP-binding protein